MCSSTSLKTSFILNLSCRVVRDDRADRFSEKSALDVARLAQRENIDRNGAAAGEINGGGVHDLQPLGEDALVGGVIDLHGRRILFGIGRVDAVDLRGLEDDLALQLAGAKRGGGVGGEERISGPSGADDDASLFQVTHRAPANERLGDL